MKKIITKAACLMAILTFAANYSHAQLNGFVLTPSGNTENYMKYIRKAVTVNGTSYYTAYLTLSSFRNVTTNTYYNDITPFGLAPANVPSLSDKWPFNSSADQYKMN